MVKVYTVRSKLEFQSPTGTCQDRQNLDDELAHIGSWANTNDDARIKATTDSEDAFTPSAGGIQPLLRHPDADHIFNSTTELPSLSSPLGKSVNSIQPVHGLKFSDLTTTNLSNAQDGPSQLELWRRDFRSHQEIFSLVASGSIGIEQTGNITTDHPASGESSSADICPSKGNYKS